MGEGGLFLNPDGRPLTFYISPGIPYPRSPRLSCLKAEWISSSVKGKKKCVSLGFRHLLKEQEAGSFLSPPTWFVALSYYSSPAVSCHCFGDFDEKNSAGRSLARGAGSLALGALRSALVSICFLCRVNSRRQGTCGRALVEGTYPCQSWSALLVEARPGQANHSPGPAFKAPCPTNWGVIFRWRQGLSREVSNEGSLALFVSQSILLACLGPKCII